MTEPEPLREGLTAFAEQDPLWAALARPSTRGSARYLENLFATGRREVDEVLAALADRGIALGRARALDFGCGIGRLTRGLAEHFAACDGVDLSASLIERARALGKAGGRVRFHHAICDDLRQFADSSFDFILAPTGLWHVAPGSIPGYIREFVRVLRPGGVAFINLPHRFVPAEELPREGWKATVTAPRAVSPVGPGEVFLLELDIHNDSLISWPSSAQLRVGQRWRGSDGGVVAIGALGAAIPETVDPGGDCEPQVWVVAPLEPGGYELEVDLGQQKFGWFADRGSRPLKLAVTVAAEETATATPGAIAGQCVLAQSEHSGPASANEAHVMACQAVVATVEDAGGVVLEMLATDRSDPSMRSFDYVLASALSPARRAEPDQRAAIDARIRRALRYTAGSAALSAQLRSSHLQPSQRRREALHLMDERADLVGFGLTSGLKGLARASTLVREGLRRALFEVLFRQSEFNQATGELIRGHEEQLKALGATVRAQLDIEAGADERLAALEQRLARLEVDSAQLARGAERDAARPGPADRHAPD